MQRDLTYFMAESAINRDCTIKKRYTHLLEKTLHKQHATVSSALLRTSYLR
jgi:hypothetical protein